MLNQLIYVQKPLRMDKIGHISISVRVFAPISFAKLVINFAFLKFFAICMTFQNQCKTKFLTYFTIS